MHFIVFANVLHDLHIINTVEYMIQCNGAIFVRDFAIAVGWGSLFCTVFNVDYVWLWWSLRTLVCLM